MAVAHHDVGDGPVEAPPGWTSTTIWNSQDNDAVVVCRSLVERLKIEDGSFLV